MHTEAGPIGQKDTISSLYFGSKRRQQIAPRILSALKASGTSALDSLLDHPAASFAIAALEDWQQTQSS